MKTLTPRRFATVLSVAAFALTIGACKGGSGDTGGFTHKNDPNNLKELWQTMMAASVDGKNDKALALAKGLLMNDAAFKVALKDGTDQKIIDAIKKQQKRMADAKPEDVGKMFKPERTEVQVHGATPKQIIAQESEASKEFPGGAKRAAQSVLKEDVTFYEVEMVEPGQKMGMKMHLMFWDGSQWRMLGAVWRGMQRN